MDIAILGAGVAGVSSAIELTKRGYRVSIYERYDSAATIGAGIVVWPNAAYILEQIGVLDDIKSASGCPTKMRRLSSRGEDLGAIDIELINKHMGYPSLSILRTDFQDILINKLRSLGVSIRYGYEVTGIEAGATCQAKVCFENGEHLTADVIIGADGRMASHARQYVAGDNAPVYQGFINWIGVFESDCDVFDAIEVSDYWGVGERFGIVPITRRKAYWAGGIASSDIGPRNTTEYKNELRSVFSSWPEAVQLMIERTPVERINKIYIHDHNPIRTWHKDNVIVIGDAAHAPLPTSGQGACQALEDAWHLANCLDEAPDPAKAFARFTKIRFDKTAGIIMAARGFASSLFNRDADFCKTRNENSKTTDYVKVAAAMSRGWAQNLPLGADPGHV